jgi:hypothetical protein
MATTIKRTVKQTIGEHDVVAFTETIAKNESTGSWPAGTIGAVVSDFGDHKMIEIVGDKGETLDMPIVPVEKLKLITKSKHSNANGSIRPARQKRRKPQRATASSSSVA